MVNVQVRQQDRVHARQVQTQFADAKERAWPRVHQDSRRAINHHDVTRARASERPRTAGAEHDHFEWSFRASRRASCCECSVREKYDEGDEEGRKKFHARHPVAGSPRQVG